MAKATTAGTAVAPQDDNTDIEQVTQAAEALAAAQNAEFEGLQVQTPILKLCQGLTKEVKDGDAEAGDFLNTLSGDSLGPEVEFIPAAFQQGRAASLKDGRYFVAIAQDVIPESWEPVVGAEFVGTRFDEYPDAEEQFKRRVNSKEIEWGSGPAVTTTYNFTGHVIVPPLEGSDEEEERQPVRIAFQRTTKSAADRIVQLFRMSRQKALWDQTYRLKSKEKPFGRNTSYIVEVTKGRATASEERLDSAELATATFSGRIQEVGNGGDKQVAPDANGGLGV